MSQADQILYQPVRKPKTFQPEHQLLIDTVLVAVNGGQEFEFSIEDTVPFEVYEKIIDLIENDPRQIIYLNAMVKADPSLRPPNALTISDVFRHIKAGETKFYHCGKANSAGSHVGEFEFANVFGVKSQHLLMELKGRRIRFEWWSASLHAGYSGHNFHYSFATETEARKHFYG